ncbi:hypothetical protein NDU88_005965 [Pleurodeles waltl]|uniref:Uncharacterized protein n=1 Tax=Pleurodeles waltl TaxID=8319 RepID=A0AAV7QG92_PLEWA|nr:hypothetical protein NDU88_005965 [Pleurodeles waltl]
MDSGPTAASADPVDQGHVVVVGQGRDVTAPKVGVASARAARKGSCIKDMFAKAAGKKADRTEKEGSATPDATLEVDVRVTRLFLENLFTTLRDDIEALKQELAADVKDGRCNMGETEQRVDSLEKGSNH